MGGAREGQIGLRSRLHIWELFCLCSRRMLPGAGCDSNFLRSSADAPVPAVLSRPAGERAARLYDFVRETCAVWSVFCFGGALLSKF